MMIAVSSSRGIQQGADFRYQYRAVAAGVMVYEASCETIAKAEILVGQIAVSRSWKGTNANHHAQKRFRASDISRFAQTDRAGGDLR